MIEHDCVGGTPAPEAIFIIAPIEQKTNGVISLS
jgi:hypothetical protein